MANNQSYQAFVDRIDWMYDEPVIRSKEDAAADEYFDSKFETDVKDASLVEEKPAQQKSQQSLFLPSLSRASEDTLRKIREDPLFLIKQAEVQQVENYYQKMKYERLLKTEVKKELGDARSRNGDDKRKHGGTADHLPTHSRPRQDDRRRHDSTADRYSPRSRPHQNDRRRHDSTADRHSPRSRPHQDDRRRGNSTADQYSPRSRHSDKRRHESTGDRHSPRSRPRHNEKRDHDITSILGPGLEKQSSEVHDRARRIQEMQDEGLRHEREKDRRLAELTAKEARQAAEESALRERKDKRYLKQMNDSVYLASDMTLEERLRRKAGKRDRTARDDEL